MSNKSKKAVIIFSCTVICALTALNGFAQHFKPGNIAVVRVGTPGKTNIYTSPNEVFIDEYTPGGTFVRTIPLPSKMPAGFRV
ncbi:MAG: hypothetical protein JST39_00775, partial [Bacteroidetes bacterium]|nr:hypothetical protein [Bacteroidota bacterium]